MTRGKVVLVPFPFDDLSTQKARPAVCLTEPFTSHRHIVLAFVTSRTPDGLLDTDIVLDPQDPGFAQTRSRGSVDDSDLSPAHGCVDRDQEGTR